MYRATMQGKGAEMKIISNNRGAAFFLTVMFLFIGIAIDIGWMTYVKNQGQAAVDAATLSGVSAIPDETEVYNRVSTFNGKNTVIDADQNHLSSTNVEFITYDGTDFTPAADPALANGIRVAMEAESNSAIHTPFFFSAWRRFFAGTALGSADINVSATAVVPNKPGLPIALLGCKAGAKDFVFDQTPDPEDNSSFTSFTIESASANDFKNMVSDPNTYIPPVEPNSMCIYLNNGQVNATLKENKSIFLIVLPLASSCRFSMTTISSRISAECFKDLPRYVLPMWWTLAIRSIFKPMSNHATYPPGKHR
jgi:hypothetical protein